MARPNQRLSIPVNTLELPGGLSKILILRHHLKPIKSEFLGVGNMKADRPKQCRPDRVSECPVQKAGLARSGQSRVALWG